LNHLTATGSSSPVTSHSAAWCSARWWACGWPCALGRERA